jgi:pyridoxamine 5'-phosphate oxidase
MDLQNCVQFANENLVCFIATTEGEQPRVRAVMLWYADETGFYFETLSPKDMSKQLHQNSKVEICFYNHPEKLEHAKQMRLTGEIEFIDDPEIKAKAYEARKFLEDIVGSSIEPYVEVFRMSSGDAHFWTMADILKEQTLEHLKF